MKPWGTETLLTGPDSPYCMKVLRVNPNSRLSLQAHAVKDETLVLIWGTATLEIDGATVAMEQYQPYHIPPMVKHRLSAQSHVTVIEASTPEVGTTYRYEDDYGRGDD